MRACIITSPLLFFSNNKKEVKTIAKQDLFINDEIRVREVRLIGLEGEQLGIKPLSEAQALADSANVDLVLIQPQAKPPVAKIMDYKTNSSEDYMLAGKDTHPYIMALSYGATFISTAAIVGSVDRKSVV